MLVDDAGLARLVPGRFHRLVQLDRTESTNAVVAERALAGEPEGLVVAADYQSAGRGRFDRRWEAAPGTALLFSVLLRPSYEELAPGRRHVAVAAVSLAMADAVSTLAGVRLQLKWPNDLLAPGPLGGGDDRPAGPVGGKVAGVLAEAPLGPTSEALVVGMGVNISWAPEDVGATCLEALTGRKVDRGALLVEALVGLSTLYGHWDLVSERYRLECATVGRDVVVQPGGGRPDIVGRAVEVNGSGQLVVLTPDGRYEVVVASDVTHATHAAGEQTA